MALYSLLAAPQLCTPVAAALPSHASGFGEERGGVEKVVEYEVFNGSVFGKYYDVVSFQNSPYVIGSAAPNLEDQVVQLGTSPVLSDEWISVSPGSCDQALINDDDVVYDESAATALLDFNLLENDSEELLIESELAKYLLEDAPLPPASVGIGEKKEQACLPVLNGLDAAGPVNSCPSEVMPPISGHTSQYIATTSYYPAQQQQQEQPIYYQPQPVAGAAAPSGKRKRKASHSLIKDEDFNDAAFLQFATEERGECPTHEAEIAADTCADEDFWNLFYDDDAASGHQARHSIDDSGSDLLGDDHDRQERKRALNREAAHRYRTKQKRRQSKESQEYVEALRAMRRAERAFHNKRSSLAVMTGVVVDLLH